MMLKVRPAEAQERTGFLKDMRIKRILEQWITGTLVVKTGNFAFLFYHVSSRTEYWFNEMSE